MTAVAHFPASLDKRPLERLRRPLAALAAMILVIDLMGLGMHLADSVDSPFASDTPTRAKTQVGGAQSAIVPSDAIPGTGTAGRQAARVSPVGCLARDAACYAGPPADGGSGTGNGTNPSGGATPPTNPPKPLVQAGLAVPALGARLSLGAGDGSCTGLGLTALDVGGCPPATGDGPVVLNLGGTLLGN